MGRKTPDQRHLRRAFLALKTDRGQTHLLQPVRDAMPADWLKNNPHNDHISLAFIGKLTPEQSGSIRSLVREFAAAAKPVSISFPTLGTFHNIRPGKEKDDKGKSYIVVYAAPDPAASQKIQSLHHDLAYKVLRPNGFNFGITSMVPHNTLAHIRDEDDERPDVEKFMEEHSRLDIPPARYTSIVLMDSYDSGDSMHPAKHDHSYSKYWVVEEFPLGGGTSPPAPAPAPAEGPSV